MSSAPVASLGLHTEHPESVLLGPDEGTRALRAIIDAGVAIEERGGFFVPAWGAERSIAFEPAHNEAYWNLAAASPGVYFGGEAEARDLIEIAKRMRAGGACVIFVESDHAAELASAVAVLNGADNAYVTVANEPEPERDRLARIRPLLPVSCTQLTRVGTQPPCASASGRSSRLRTKLHIHCGLATHFLRWEMPHWDREFELVAEPSEEADLLCFGPDAIWEAANLPARRRIAYLFPGFSCNPVHNKRLRHETLEALESAFHLVLINPGPLQLTYGHLPQVRLCPFSIDTSIVRPRRFRTEINRLIHISNDCPQKDHARSMRVMHLTGLARELFPPRDADYVDPFELDRMYINRHLADSGQDVQLQVMPPGYVPHRRIIEKYHENDGFVHIAGEIHDPMFLDGKYTATLLEAGLTGAILFWHDTFSLGNDFETIFALPKEPGLAAKKLLEIRGHLDVEAHSRSTSEEILDRCDPVRSVAIRSEAIRSL